MHHFDPRCECRRLRWPAVDKYAGSVDHDDVAQLTVACLSRRPCPSFTDTRVPRAPGRLAAVPPDGNTTPGVVVVGPDQELQALAAEFEMGGQLVDGAPTEFWGSQRRRVHCQLDNNRAAIKPVAVELFRRRSRVLQRGVVNDHPRARCPVQGWFVSGENHHPAAQLGRPV